MVDHHIIAAHSRQSIKDPIFPWIELVHFGRSLTARLPRTDHKQVTQSERHSLGIKTTGSGVQRRGTERRHGVVSCPILAIRPRVQFKDLVPIVIREEEMVVTGIKRDPSGFLGVDQGAAGREQGARSIRLIQIEPMEVIRWIFLDFGIGNEEMPIG